MFLQWMLVVVMPLLTAACGPRPANYCHCMASPDKFNGCLIHTAAPQGFKCACEYSLSTVTTYMSPPRYGCKGEAIPCRYDEACPGGRYSYCACVQGGGNCLGYKLRPSTVGSCPKVNKVEDSSSLPKPAYKSCNCEYFSVTNNRGCRIVEAAEEGFKCSCRYEGSRQCYGQSQGCDEDEYCPANDYTYCACRRGGGNNCNGYPLGDTNQVCDLGTTCDCNHSNGRTKDRYSVVETEFNTDNMRRSNPRIVLIGHVIDLQNESEGTQRQVKTYDEIWTTEFSFERTHGMSMDLGMSFSAIVPISLTSSTSRSFKYGVKTVNSIRTSNSYTCEGPRKSHTRCSAFLMKTDISVPYSMLLKHKVIPDCVCRSYGNFKSTTSSYSSMTARHIGPCNRIVFGLCVAK